MVDDTDRMRKGRRDSRSGEGSSSRGPAVKPLKKGPWTSDEDAILIAYVQKHGEGNWNAVQKHSGLSRCGKSCRLRWANHLRPDLKKGAFTQEEERRIIELHAIMGNKWARMAAELPGRTDNEIKNFWNTRLKRLQRAGLPIYPDEVRQQVMNVTQNGQNIDALANGDSYGHDSLQEDRFEIPEVEFEHLGLSKSFLSYPSILLDLPLGGMLKQGTIGPPDAYNFMAPQSLPNHKCIRESETLFSAMDGCATSETQFVNYAHEKAGDSLAIYVSYTSDLNTTEWSSQLNTLPDSHSSGNATYSSSSEPLIPGATKLELPSLQYLDSQHVGSWDTPSNLMPALESVDTLIQSPLTDQTKSDCPSSHNNGLLESVLFESQVLNGSAKHVDSSRTRSETKIDSICPLIQSSSSVIAAVSGSSSGCNSKFEQIFKEVKPDPSVEVCEEIPVLTDWVWDSSTNSNEKYKCFNGDFIGDLLGEDLSSY